MLKSCLWQQLFRPKVFPLYFASHYHGHCGLEPHVPHIDSSSTWGKYSKWIVILQEFDLEFSKSKAKKSLVFVELICDLPHTDENIEPSDSLPDESLFLISTSNPWYGDILLYLQTQPFHPGISRDERCRIRHHSKHYLIIGNTLYHRGIETVLRRCLTHEEVEQVLNDCHLGACGGHLSGMATTQKILCASYFWPSIFKDCIEAIKKFPPCHIF
jgi:hypothetical protein